MLEADHVAFRVYDLDEAIRFYTEALGLALRFRQVDEEHGEAFAFVELAGCAIELLQVLGRQTDRPPAARPEPPYCPHLAIRTRDLAGQMRALADRGVPLLRGPLEIPGQVRWAYYADPDANVIEFVEWIPKEEP